MLLSVLMPALMGAESRPVFSAGEQRRNRAGFQKDEAGFRRKEPALPKKG
jgi:hypothetical protein